ncbi:hypothetical protein [Desulfocurvibacter africanus]|uniref:hypothetical protein n=1 Tax=Desulfocurvibacter africanus TaxID=873 RepID=UPI0012B5CE18|nr:hypothetical protein [Desulfocurvibacter africanus]
MAGSDSNRRPARQSRIAESMRLAAWAHSPGRQAPHKPASDFARSNGRREASGGELKHG